MVVNLRIRSMSRKFFLFCWVDNLRVLINWNENVLERLGCIKDIVFFNNLMNDRMKELFFYVFSDYLNVDDLLR